MQSNPTTAIFRRTFRYRIYPTRAQVTAMSNVLRLCRELYNAALQERRDAWKCSRTPISFAGQSAQLPEIKQICPDLCAVYSQTLQDVLHRVDKTYKAFFDRCAHGGAPGFPRFKNAGRFRSFTYPQTGWSLEGNCLTLAKVGTVRVVKHRELLGKVKTCSVIRDGSKWYCAIVCEVILPSVECSDRPPIGIDVGLSYFASLSNGEQIANPRHGRKAEKRLATAQRRLAKLGRTNSRRKRARKHVAAAYRKITNQRQNFAHQMSHDLVSRFGLIAVEDLNIKGLASGMLARSVNDVAWARFIACISYKAESAGTTLIAVNPRGTSQTCPGCGAIAKKTLADRWHSCICGCELPRDVAAAQVILARGLASIVRKGVEATGLSSEWSSHAWLIL